ncbi:hypothetical protein Adu01nite_69470 [Paractinoplanes durhamensis]|uniref:Methyltransferase type 11 domain-containing protein n=1 Tax=Paractinoplanes durhamensis TaxID=113563 RepID=A0ABQ3Z6Z2_9ACTN|nr:hypothetical protein Adu01nite_69470 [Actinoplanes durhamensis]
MRTGDDDYDAAHGAVYSSRLVPQLWAEAYGDEYPAEVEPFSSCTWWLLGRLIGGLRLRRDSVLVDLGCGRGGPGLWLARACSTRLIGVDFSEVATRLAGERAATFLRPGRAEFRRAAFADTGLPSGGADAAVSVDALPFAPDRPAALAEVFRILRPGARFAMTARVRPEPEGDWPALAAAAGFEVEQSIKNENHDKHWIWLYELWLRNEPQLRAELGERVTANLIREARAGLQRLPDPDPAELLILRRPLPGQHLQEFAESLQQKRP